MSEHEPVYLTAEGIESLRHELDHLVSVKRKELAGRLRRAIRQGDLSENADYITAKEEQGFLEGRIQQIEAMLRGAVRIRENVTTETVSLGNRVTVVEQGTEEAEVFLIVGPAEANPSKGRLSYESPLGRAIRGRSVGDAVSVDAPEGIILFQIARIE